MCRRFLFEYAMKFYFSTRNIPQLKGLPLTERVKRLDRAASRMTVPEKNTHERAQATGFHTRFCAYITNRIELDITVVGGTRIFAVPAFS